MPSGRLLRIPLPRGPVETLIGGLGPRMESLFGEVADLVLRGDVIAVIVVCAFYGLFIGSVPGLTATMSVALLVPITFFMDAGAGNPRRS